MPSSEDSVRLLDEIAAILVAGYVRLQVRDYSPSSRPENEQSVASDAQNRLDSLSVQSEGWRRMRSNDTRSH